MTVMNYSNAEAEHVFEISFEVCNKVGGIYTVVSSKAKLMKEIYKDLVLIGPYFEHQAKQEFKEETPPFHIQQAINALSGQGITFRYGKWLINGEPKVILIDFRGQFDQVNEYKALFWDKFKLDSLNAGFDYDEPLAFSIAAGKLIEQIVNKSPGKYVCHTHEWMTGFANLYLKAKNVNIGTVFTTHATMLGRAMSSTGIDLYEAMKTFNAEEEARKNNVYAKFSAEKVCAHVSDVFTTVSQFTADETECVLGKKPDYVLINGLDKEQFPAFEDAALLHVENRERLREFCMYYFFPHYTFELDHTLFFYTSGRHEVRNKGIDLTIASLARLNNKLKQEKSKRTIVTFFWVPHNNYGARTEVLESKTYFRHIKNYINRHGEELHKKIINNIMMGEDFEAHQLFDNDFHRYANRLRSSFKREGKPPLCAFNCDEDHEILQLFMQHGLSNAEDDRVKVILYPLYLTGLDGVLDFSYYEAVSACHLGLFPSFYEPWGYTPAESIAMGVPSVTSDLAGFGIFAEEQCKDNCGTWVIHRRGKTFDEQVQALTNTLMSYAMQDHYQRIDQNINAKRLSYKVDWAILIKNYIDAHNMAVKKSKK